MLLCLDRRTGAKPYRLFKWPHSVVSGACSAVDLVWPGIKASSYAIIVIQSHRTWPKFGVIHPFLQTVHRRCNVCSGYTYEIKWNGRQRLRPLYHACDKRALSCNYTDHICMNLLFNIVMDLSLETHINDQASNLPRAT